MRNPYYFAGQFSGVFVEPAGYALPTRLMANHSAQYPDGYLDRDTLKSFFGMTGASGSFAYTPGGERIPDNWYKRPTTDLYSISS